jgi:hypothetical protein
MVEDEMPNAMQTADARCQESLERMAALVWRGRTVETPKWGAGLRFPLTPS